MNRKFIPGFLLICALASPAALRCAEMKNCELKRLAAVDFPVPQTGFLLVPVTVQGTDAFMILNTVSAVSTITEIAANRLGLKVGRIPFGLTIHEGSKKIENVATAKGLTLGNAHFDEAQFLVIANNSFGPGPGDIQAIGMLGMNTFTHIDLELDLAHGKMNVFSQDHCPGKVVYWAKSYDSVPIRLGKLGEIYFPMELDGKKIETTLATGNSTSTVFSDATMRLFKFDSHSPGVEADTDASGRATAYYRPMKLSGEGLQIFNARIKILDRPTDNCPIGSRLGAAAYDTCYGMHPLELGRNVLNKLRIYIATKERVLYFTPADATD